MTKNDHTASGAAPDFETRLKRLQEIVARLEQGDLPLEEGVSLYKEGAALAKACAAQLEAARNEILVVGGEMAELLEPAEGEEA